MSMHTHVHTHVRTHPHTHVHIHVRIHVHIHVHTNVHTNVLCIHTHVYTRVHAHVYTHVYTYVHAHVQTQAVSPGAINEADAVDIELGAGQVTMVQYGNVPTVSCMAYVPIWSLAFSKLQLVWCMCPIWYMYPV